MPLKFCLNCHEYFEAPLLDPVCCCSKPECQKKFETYYVRKFLRQRFVQYEYLNVYDADHSTVCRICGKPYLGVDGKRRYRHYCNEHAGKGMEIIAKRYIWSAVATEYLSQRCKQQGVKWNLCEVCHKIVKDIQVHHKIPVHTLDASNYKLVWDLTKLIAAPGGRQPMREGMKVGARLFAYIRR